MAGFFENLGAKNARKMILEENFLLSNDINFTRIISLLKSFNIFITNVDSQEKSFQLQIDDAAKDTSTTVYMDENRKFFQFNMGTVYNFSEANLKKALEVSNKINVEYLFVCSKVMYDERKLMIAFSYNFSYGKGILIHQLVDAIQKFRASSTEAYVNEVAKNFS